MIVTLEKNNSGKLVLVALVIGLLLGLVIVAVMSSQIDWGFFSSLSRA